MLWTPLVRALILVPPADTHNNILTSLLPFPLVLESSTGSYRSELQLPVTESSGVSRVYVDSLPVDRADSAHLKHCNVLALCNRAPFLSCPLPCDRVLADSGKRVEGPLATVCLPPSKSCIRLLPGLCSCPLSKRGA